MGGWRLESPASLLLTQPFMQAQIKENIKALRHWPLCVDFTVTGEFHAQMASNAEMFPFDDVIMYICSGQVHGSRADTALLPRRSVNRCDGWWHILNQGAAGMKPTFDGLVQDCSISIANAPEILQSCTNHRLFYASTQFLLIKMLNIDQLSLRWCWWIW